MKLSNKIKLTLKSLLMKCGSVETDKAVLQYDGEELEVGMEVFVESEEGDVVPAEDGEYVAGEKTYVVSEGKVTEIREKEEETTEEEVEISASKQKFNKVKAAFEETYEEKTQKIYAAISNLLGHNDFWVREAADDFAIAELWIESEDMYKDFKFTITWDEDGNAIASDQVEVKEEFVPVDEPATEEQFAEEPAPADEPEEQVNETKSTEEKVADLAESVGDIREGIEQLTNAIAAVAKRLDAVEEKINGLEEPAAEPAEEGEETEVKASRLSYLRK